VSDLHKAFILKCLLSVSDHLININFLPGSPQQRGISLDARLSSIEVTVERDKDEDNRGGRIMMELQEHSSPPRDPGRGSFHRPGAEKDSSERQMDLRVVVEEGYHV